MTIDLGGSINGLAFGPGATTGVHVAGTPKGLPPDGVPLVTADQQRAGGGVVAGWDRRGGRTITYRFLLLEEVGGDPLADIIDAFVEATPQLPFSTIPLRFDGGTKELQVKVRGREFVIDAERQQRSIEADLVLFAPDPNYTVVTP